MTLDHISIPVHDLEKSASFYSAVLEPLGLNRTLDREGAVGFGASGRAPSFWILRSKSQGTALPGYGLHISFTAPTRQAVDDFHSIGLASGGKDLGSPGPRPEYTQPFYGAFLMDLDGFKVEAVCRVGGGD